MAMELRQRLTPAQRQRMAASQKYLCGICHELLPAAWSVDHKTALWAGGTNELSNLWVICANCHAEKTMQEAIEREAAKRERRLRSPYFQDQEPLPPPPPPPPFVLRRRCRAPIITMSFSEP